MIPTQGFFRALACLAAASLILSHAQVAPVQPAPGAPSTPVQLSAFEVTSDKDVGYQAGNTTSGSRLNSSLKDTAAAVMVFTPEFMSDFSVNSLADMVAYAPNMAVDMLDTAADANPQFLGGADYRDSRIRVRGLSASTSQDFFETGIPIDAYNTERVELSSGPNSILFGFGSPGGLVNIMTKRAQANRNRTSIRTQFGQWRYNRAELDHNQVIVPGKVALRLNGPLPKQRRLAEIRFQRRDPRCGLPPVKSIQEHDHHRELRERPGERPRHPAR